MGSEGSINEESQVSGCYNFYLNQPVSVLEKTSKENI